jgi:Tol biopolymer transport system component
LTGVFVTTTAAADRLRQVTTDPAFDGSPAWSPDGSAISFNSERGGNYDMWVIKTDYTAVAPVVPVGRLFARSVASDLRR